MFTLVHHPGNASRFKTVYKRFMFKKRFKNVFVLPGQYMQHVFHCIFITLNCGIEFQSLTIRGKNEFLIENVRQTGMVSEFLLVL